MMGVTCQWDQFIFSDIFFGDPSLQEAQQDEVGQAYAEA